MRLITITLAFLFIGHLSVAQEDFIPKHQVNDFNQYQDHFQNWINQGNNKDQKGYKWYQRWLEFNATRTGAYGKTVSNESYLNAALKVNATKHMDLGSRATDTTWIPEGPDTLVPAYSSSSSHGVARVNTIAFHPTDTNTYWVGVSQGGIWKTTNRGKTYIPMNTGLPILRISDIAVDPNHPDTLYASVCDYAYIGVALTTDGRKRNTHYGIGIYKSYDGGMSWSPTGLTYLQTKFDYSLIRRIFVNPTNSSELVCAGVDGIFKSYDGGDNWTRKRSELIWDLEKNPHNHNTLFASSGYLKNLGVGVPKMMKSHDFGETWDTVGANVFNATEQMQRVEITISRLDTNQLYAISCGDSRGLYGFYRSSDGGNTWSKTIDANSGPNILEWNQGGSGGGQGTYDLTVYVDENDKDKVYVGGVNMWGSDDGGATWDGISYWRRIYGFTPHADQHFLTFNPLDQHYYMCNDGGIFRTDTIKIGSWNDAQNGGGYEFPTKWEDVSSGMQITSLYRIGISDSVPGYMVAGAQDNGTFYRDDQRKWTNITGGDGMDCVLDPIDPKSGVSSSQGGYFYRFSNGGRSVRNFAGSIFDNGGWTTPIEAHPTARGTYFLGYTDVWKGSNTTGFNRVGNIPDFSNQVISALDVAISGNKAFVVAARRPNFAQNIPTKLFYTDNDGANWTNITLGLPDSLYCTAVILDDRDPKKIWATFGGFVSGSKVYYSDNSGATWTNISGTLPNVPVNTICQDKSSAEDGLYIGCDVGIYYKNNISNSWKLYANGFPNVIVSDLEIQYKERRLYASTFGRGVWSVGVMDTVHVFPKDTTKKDTLINVSVDQQKFESAEFALYPNPNTGNFKLQVKSGSAINYKIGIVNVMGKTVYTHVVEESIGEQVIPMDVNLSSGMYYLRIDGAGRSKVQRFVVYRE